MRCDVYGEGNGYHERVMVIYDGLHYDALAMGGQKGHSGIVCGWACREGPDPNSLLLPQ